MLTRLLFSLLAVKMIATYGSEGALTNWGVAQNTISLLAAVLGFSVQSGVAARVANGMDPHAFGRGLQILLIGTGGALFALLVLGQLNDRELGFPDISVVAVLSAASAGAGSLVIAYLPVTGRVFALSGFYFSVGAVTCMLLLIVDWQDINDLMLAIGGGWIGGVVFFFASSRQYRAPSFFSVRWDNEKNKRLLWFGVASIANGIAQMGAILLTREAVIDSAGLQGSDLFESSMRLAMLLEGTVGSIASVILWRRIADNNTNLIKVVIALLAFALASLSLAYLLFELQGGAIVNLLFSEKFSGTSSYNDQVFVLAALKIAYALLVIPVFLAGRTSALIMIECLFIATIYIQAVSLGLLLTPVSGALQNLIWSNAASLGVLIFLLITGSKVQPRSLSSTP